MSMQLRILNRRQADPGYGASIASPVSRLEYMKLVLYFSYFVNQRNQRKHNHLFHIL